jgi:ABC-type dipeptide/oligopeptide/nickel transport system permease subunit
MGRVRRLHGLVASIARKSQALVMPEWQQKAEQGWWVPPARALACSRALRFGFTLVALVALGGVLVPLFAPYAPDQIIAGARLQAPSMAHPFGTDALGRDMLSRIGYGSHLAVRMALLAVGMSLCIGLVLGSLAGYYGGWLDQIISRVMDGWIALPGALVAIVIVARLGASFENLIVALGLMGVPAFYRIVRSTTMSMRRMPFVEAAISIGATNRRVMWLHVFPNILPSIVVLATLHMGTALLTGSSLSFIGLGAQPPLPEWGALLAAGKTHFETAWWLAVFPGLAVTASVVGLNLLGDGLRDVLDPRFAAAAELRSNPGESAPPAVEPSAPCQGGRAPESADRRREPAPALAVMELDRDR